MKTGVIKACSRCKNELHCKVDSIEECECSKIEVSQDCLDFLKKTKYDCLCNRCLLEVDQLIQKADSIPSKPIENVHYYIEDGMLVFTELNHIQRGYCCQSNCRHCAYGYNLT